MRYGRQEPTFERVDEYERTDGPKAAALFEGYGVKFIPAQKHELDLFLAKNALDECAAISIGVSKPRQNGKSFGARFYALWASFVEGKSVLYSAHNGATTRKMFKFMADFIERHPDFQRKLKRGDQGVYRAKGAEGIYLADGTVIEFSTRTNSGARGGTYDVVIVDEAQELTDEQLDAIKPTIIASDAGDPQMIYLGTPPGPKCPGTVFRGLHDRAHADEGAIWWVEWAAEEVGDPMDLDRWYECNPMMGYRIKERVMNDAASTTAADSFAREYLGWWSGEEVEQVEHVFTAEEWGACKTDRPLEDGIMGVGVKFSPDGSRATLAVALRPEDVDYCTEVSPAYVEVLETRQAGDGIEWIARWILARENRIAQIVIDGRSGSGALVQRLHEQAIDLYKGQIWTPNMQDMTTAISMFVNAVRERAVTHFDQGPLNAAMTRCAKRPIGKDGFGFADTPEGDATAAEAVALAYWGAVTTRYNPSHQMLIAW